MKEFLKFFPDTQDSPLAISLSGVTSPDPEYHITRNCSKVSVIEYVLSGRGYVNIRGVCHPVGADTVYFLPMGEAHDYRSDKNDPFTKIFMNVKGVFGTELFRAYGLAGQVTFSGKEVRPLFEKIPDLLRAELPDGEKQAALQGLYVQILAKLSQGRQAAGISSDVLVMKNYLDDHLHRRVSTQELAKLVFRSADYCEKTFRRELGTTPYAYQLDQKIQKAKALLSHTQMSVGAIGQSLGYEDLHYFSNLFYQKCGIRPLGYRKKYR